MKVSELTPEKILQVHVKADENFSSLQKRVLRVHRGHVQALAQRNSPDGLSIIYAAYWVTSTRKYLDFADYFYI